MCIRDRPSPDWPDDGHGATHDAALGDAALGAAGALVVGAGVRGVGAMVAHHPYLAGGNPDVERLQARLIAGEEVGLVQRRAVDREPLVAVAADDVVPRQPDDPLDQMVALVAGQQPDKGQRRLKRACLLYTSPS